MQLRVEFQFNAAHRLPYYDGPCFHTHGHNYRLLVFVEGRVDPGTGMSVDFEAIRRLVQERILSHIDHNDLNGVLENPTAENVVMWIWERLCGDLPGLVELQLYETQEYGVIYRGKADGQAALAR